MNKRIYSGTDAHMLGRCIDLHAIFEPELVRFTAFDPSLDATFAANWMAEIKSCAATPHNRMVRAFLSDYVAKTKESLADCRTKFQDVKYFVNKAFPKQTAIHEEFGSKRYRVAQRSAPRMIIFMDELHAAAQKYAAELNAAGFQQPAIDEILTLRDMLSSKHLEQESYKNGRPVLSSNRIEKLNNCYRYAVSVCAAAQRIFLSSYARRKQFVYEPLQKTVYHEAIEPNSYNMVAETIRANRKFSIENKGTVALEFGFSNANNSITTNRITVSPGKKVVVAKRDFQPPNGNFLVAYNPHAQAGEYRVKG